MAKDNAAGQTGKQSGKQPTTKTTKQAARNAAHVNAIKKLAEGAW